MVLMDVRTGQIVEEGTILDGMMVLPVNDAEPYYEQRVRSKVRATDRTGDGRYDRSHLSPENSWRIGRDFLAHCLRYGWPMKVIREHFGAGARILEMGCGAEVPVIRTLTMDLSAVEYYKPTLYVGFDLNSVRYRPRVTGIDIRIHERANVIDQPELIDGLVFDIVLSFEVLEHMDKPDGERFLDAMVAYARRREASEGKKAVIMLSTPVNGGLIAKNHIYEWRRDELARAWTNRGCKILAEYGMFADLRDIVEVLTPAEREVWNQMVQFHSPHTLSCFFATVHPEAARNIAWLVEP